MNVRTLLRRLRISAQVVQGDPKVVLRIPKFVWRFLKEGPRASLDRVRLLSDPERFAPSYSTWLEAFHLPTPEEREAMQLWARQGSEMPLIAVLMPVFNPRPEWLEAAIASVRAQLYPHWQLCIADDYSTDPSIQAILVAAAAEDDRIKVVFRDQNGHISACSNSALELVTAPWVALLDHDDLLPNDALIWLARAIQEHPEARLLYSDEDKVSDTGLRRDPYFKPDWNPVLMEGQNVICHLACYSTELVREVGVFRLGLEGAQDHDLALRCAERLERHQIVHIPRVLYHWRVHEQSTAAGVQAKPYSNTAAERAVLEHFQRIEVSVDGVDRSTAGLHARLSAPPQWPLVSVIIPTRNALKVLKPCLNSLLSSTDYPALEVLVVDNGSDDPETLRFLSQLEDQGQIRVLADPSPFNYSALNNRAVEQARADWICLMNNDIEVIQANWLQVMLAQAMRPGVGAVGAKLLYPNRRIQHGGVLLGVGGVAGHAHHALAENAYGYFSRAQLAQEVSAVTAACLLVRKDRYQQVCGLDEEYLSVAFNDVDFCLKLVQAGLRNVYEPAAVLLHHESVSRGYEDTAEKRQRFASEVLCMQRRWGHLLTSDAAYNPNLSLNGEPFRLSWPPRLQRWGGQAMASDFDRAL